MMGARVAHVERTQSTECLAARGARSARVSPAPPAAPRALSEPLFMAYRCTAAGTPLEGVRAGRAPRG